MFTSYEELSAAKLPNVIQKSLSANYGEGGNPTVIGTPVWETINEIEYLYFESTWDKMDKRMKRYHQLVFTHGFCMLVYERGNVIDADKSYSMAILKANFTNFINDIQLRLPSSFN